MSTKSQSQKWRHSYIRVCSSPAVCRRLQFPAASGETGIDCEVHTYILSLLSLFSTRCIYCTGWLAQAYTRSRLDLAARKLASAVPPWTRTRGPASAPRLGSFWRRNKTWKEYWVCEHIVDKEPKISFVNNLVISGWPRAC